MKTPTVIDNYLEQRYELVVDGHTAVLDYLHEPGRLRLTHTYVPPAIEGCGVGAQLVEGALQDARAKGLRVVPECTFIEYYIRRHPQWADMADPASQFQIKNS